MTEVKSNIKLMEMPYYLEVNIRHFFILKFKDITNIQKTLIKITFSFEKIIVEMLK